MKQNVNPQNLVAAVLAVILLCLGNVTFAKDLTEEIAMDVVTVNVNEADAEAIASTLVGVGLSRAQAIVDYRDEHGRFYSAEELTAVKGIGQTTVEKNLSRITLR
jgi:competence protein ComEA